MAEAVSQELFGLQQQLARLDKNIAFLISKIWKDIQFRSSKETVALLREKINHNTPVTKIEFLDRVLDEYIDFWSERDTHSDNKIEEYRLEAKGLRQTNTRLKAELRRVQEHSEELDRLNESLGGQGVGSTSQDTKYSLSGEDRVDIEIVSLQTELRHAKQELSLVRQRELVHKKAQPVQQRAETIPTMATNSTAEMIKKIQGLVPLFSGEPSPSLHTEVYRFIDGLNLAIADVPEGQKVTFLKLAKQRLTGDAYNLTRQLNFTDEKVLIKLLRDTYLKTRSLDSVYMEIWRAAQRPDESIREYARRLQGLANSAQAIVIENYDSDQDVVMRQELAKKIRRAFISGIRDRVVGSSLVHSQQRDLTGLLEEALVAEATFWREDEIPQARVCFAEQSDSGPDTMTGLVAAVQQLVKVAEGSIKPRDSRGDRVNGGRPNRDSMPRFPPCSFCKKQGHTREKCWERQNTPYCDQCETYGHDRGRSCGQSYSRGGRDYQSSQGLGGNQYFGRNQRSQANFAVGDQRSNGNGQVVRQNGSIQSSQGNMQTSNQGPAGGQGNQRYNRGQRPIRCFSCGLEGHRQAECQQGQQSSGN